VVVGEGGCGASVVFAAKKPGTLKQIQKRNAEHQGTFSVTTIGYVVNILADLPSIALTD
jgi:hypothetical protein